MSYTHRLTKRSVRRALALATTVVMTIAFAPAALAQEARDTQEAGDVCEDPTSEGFDDITGEETNNAAACLDDLNIVNGYPDGTYRPGTPISREQMASFLVRKLRAADQYDVEDAPASDFTDRDDIADVHVGNVDIAADTGIAQGYTDGSYGPGDSVTRGQMATFIVRQIEEIIGEELPAATEDHFDDDNGNTHEDNINIVAELGIAQGDVAGNFNANAFVTRGQMALFIARDVDYLADEEGITFTAVTEPGDAQVVVTPAEDVTLSDGAARAYTATFENEDGTVYTGQVGIELLEVEADGTADFNNTAELAYIQIVDGAPQAADFVDFNGFAGLDGAVTFVVRDETAVAGEHTVVPVAWIDSDGDGTYESTGDVEPTEPFGLGGETTFAGAPAAEATDTAATTDLVAQTVNPGGDSFTASKAGFDCGSGVAGDPCTYNYDSNDIFQLSGAAQTLAQFEAALTVGDTLTIDYDPDTADISIFNITNNTTPSATLKVTDPASATTVDANNYAVKGTGEAGQVVDIYVDSDDDAVKDTGEALVAQATIAADGTWSATVPLAQNSANNFVAVGHAAGGSVADGTAGVNIPTITESANTAPTITTAAGANGGVAGILDIGDVITLDFSRAVNAPANGDTVTMFDADGTSARLTCGGNATCAATDADTITLTVDLFPEITVAGATAGLQDPAQISATTGLEGTNNMAVSLASGDRLVDTF